MPRGRRPILKRQQIVALRRCNKGSDPAWYGRVLQLSARARNASSSTFITRIDDSTLDLHGRITVFARQALRDPSDFSVGMIYTDDDSHTYEVVRCNGGSHAHPNRWLPHVPVTPHVHYLTEFDLNHTNGRGNGDNVAFPATWSTLAAATIGLARRVRLPVEVQQAMEWR